jgi:hypothetical protein
MKALWDQADELRRITSRVPRVPKRWKYVEKEMTFDEALSSYQAFRLKIIPILTKVLPDDPAIVHKERSDLEPFFFEAMEHSADMESFYLKATALMYEKESVKSWDYACALCATEKMWSKKAQAAVLAIEGRQIRLSQNRKLSDQH